MELVHSTALDVLSGAGPWAWTVEVCDCREGLRQLPDKSVHMCVTSPPYFGLRDYGLEPTIWGGRENCRHRFKNAGKRHRGGTGGHACSHSNGHQKAKDAVADYVAGELCRCGAWRGALGLEPTVQLYVEHLVGIFEEVRRVLRDDGTLWLNLGDAYANDGKYGGETGGKQSYLGDADRRRNGRERRRTGLKPKDLIGLPWAVAFALRDAGWWLRSDVIWDKPNCLPESVNDRPTRGHEYLFLLSKQSKYFYDRTAIEEPHGFNRWSDRRGRNATVLDEVYNGEAGESSLLREGDSKNFFPGSGRNRRTVWRICTQPYPGAHFATFPTDLVAPCILAGTSEKGCCPHCGKGRVRNVEIEYVNVGNCQTNGERSENHREINQAGFEVRLEKRVRTVGWRNGCHCDFHADDAVPAIVLDPFSGAGTAGLVSRILGRRFIGFEASAAYAEQSVARIMHRGAKLSPIRPLAGQTVLF
jgi:DNA modification methylase